MKPLVSIIVLVILGAGVWYLLSQSAPVVPAGTTGTELPAATSDTTGTAATSSAPTIVYTDDGFSPASITVPAGATVTFVNQSSGRMMVGSSPHPTHQDYDGTTRAVHCAAGYTGPVPFDECTAAVTGESWTYTFAKAGTWKYHNHAAANDFGSVIVQ